MHDERLPILRLAPWVDLSEFDAIAVEWFRRLDPKRWAPSLVTTEPSPNRRLFELEPFAEEIWDLPDQMTGDAFPEFILDFVESRGVQVVHIMDSRLGLDLLPDIASLERPPIVVVELHPRAPGQIDFIRYAARRYGKLVDGVSVTRPELKKTVAGHEIPFSKISVIRPGEGASGYAELYDRLLAAPPTAGRRRDEGRTDAASAGVPPGMPEPLRLARRPPPEPTVSVGVPCFEHGIFLDRCIHSVKNQVLKPSRIVIVDDCSEDPETIEALKRWERDSKVTVLRQPSNLGPSAARNRALASFDTSYGLWIDADDELMPGALDSMVAKLEASPEEVGFIYPHVKHTGNRSDYIEMPAYNLWLLMQHNLCPSPCMFDLRVFRDTDVSYPENMVIGHEDWDLILQLAEYGVHGLPADSPTFLYRKQGFSRVNVVDYGPHDFHSEIAVRHPGLYCNSDEIKAAWAPALSIVLDDGVGAGWTTSDLESLDRQTCRDFELLAAKALGDGVRVIEVDSREETEWLQAGLREARGRWVCILTPPAAAVFEKPSFVEQMLRCFEVGEGVAAVALYDVPALERHDLARIDEEERRSGSLSGVAYERTPGAWLPRVKLGEGGSALEDLLTALQARGAVQWRLAKTPDRLVSHAAGVMRTSGSSHLDLNHRRPTDGAEAAAYRLVSQLRPRLPGRAPGSVRRWDDSATWSPVETQPLCRHRQIDGPARLVTNDRVAPSGFRFEFDLGVTRKFAQPGAQRLVRRAGTFELSDEQDALAEGRGLGYIEIEQLPACEPLDLCRMADSDHRVLVRGDDDPLRRSVELIARLGWVEPRELPPRGEALRAGPWRAVSLCREVDLRAGRHRYGVDSPDVKGHHAVLGSVLAAEGGDLVALRLRSDGRLVTDLAGPGRATRDPRKLARWVTRVPSAAGPASYWSSPTRAAYLLRHWSERRLRDEDGITLGWLMREARHGSRPLFSTTHPVTGDQLVTSDPAEAVGLGYLPDGLLGFALDAAAVDAEAPPYTVPWASV